MTTFRVTLLAILVVGLTAGQSQAATYTWILNSGGNASGNWSDITTPAWNPATYPNAAGAGADFNTLDITQDSTVTLDASLSSFVTLGSIIFGNTDASPAANWIVTATNPSTNYISLDNGGGTPGTITVNNLGAGKSANISAILSGNGFEKLGSGALTLSGANTMSGMVTVTAGTLNINNGSAIGSGVLKINGNVTLDNTTTAAITVTNSSQQQWYSDFTYTGTQSLSLGTGGALLSANRQVTVNANTLTIGGAVAGTGYTLTKAGSGTLVLSTSATYTGDTYITGGWLDQANNLGLASSPTIHFSNGGALTVHGSSNALSYGTDATHPTAVLDIPANQSGVINCTNSPSLDPSAITGTGTLTLQSHNTITSGAPVGQTITLGNGTGGTTGAAWYAFGGTLQLRNSGSTAGFAGNTFRLVNTSITTRRINALDIGPYCTFQNRNGMATIIIGALSGGDSTSYLQSGSGTVTYQIGDLNTSTNYGGRIANGSGTVNLTKVGNGTLTFSGSGGYSGTTTVSAGTLQIGDGVTAGHFAGSLGTGAVTNNSILSFNHASGAANSLTVPNTVSISGTGGSINVNGGTIYLNGAISNPATVANNAILGGAGTFSTAVTVNAGGGIESGQAGTGKLTVNSLTFQGTTAGSNNIYYQQPGLTGSNLTVTNGITTNGAGTVLINISGTNLAVGTYDLISYGTSITNFNAFQLGSLPPGAVGGRSVYGLVNNSQEIDLSVTGADNRTTWTGAANGSWDTTVRFPATTNWKFTVGGAATDFFTGDNITFDDSAPVKTVTISSGNVMPSTVTFINSAGNDYVIQGANGIANGVSLNKASGAGKVTISNNNSYTGGTTVNAGIISIAADGANPGDSAPLGAVPASAAANNLVLNTGTLNASVSFTLHANRGIALGPTSGPGSGTIDVDNGQELVVAGVIANNGNDIIGFGTGSLNKTGSGTLTLNAANTFSGTTTISGGILKLSNAAALQNSSLNYNFPGGTGGTLSFDTLAAGTMGSGKNGTIVETGIVNVHALTGSQNLALANDSGGAIFFQVGNGDVDCTYSGALSGGGTLLKTGTGTFTLTGNNIYSGDTYVNRGNVIVSGSATIDTSLVGLLHIAADVPGYGSGGNIASITFSGSSIGSFSALDIGTASRAGGNFTIQDTATVTVAGNFDINNEETAGGDTTVTTNNLINLNGGTLQVLAFVKSNNNTGHDHLATLNFNGATIQQYPSGSPPVLLPADSVASFEGVTCNVQANGAKFDTQSGNTLEIDHALVHDSTLTTADGGLTVLGTGKLIVEGNNTYTGPTVVNSGTLQIGNATAGGGTLGTGAVTLTNTTSGLYLYRTDSYVLPNAIGGAGSLDQEGSGTVILTSPNTYSGPTNVGSGTLILTGAQSTSGVTVAAGAGFGGGTTISALSLGSGATLVPSDGTNLATINVTGAVTNGGTVTIAPSNLVGTVYSVGWHQALHYGTLGAGVWTLSVPSRIVATLDYGHDANAIDIHVTAVNYPLWRGSHNNGSGAADWDTLTQNWVEYSTPAVPTNYIDPTDIVYFDDTVGAGLTNANLVGTLSPLQVNVNNNTKTYTFSGSGTISGSGALIKDGPGTLNILNTGNTYSGGTKINAGILSFATGALPAVSSPNMALIIMNGGTLQWNGTNTDDVSDRLSFVSGQTAILDLNGNTVTMANPLSFDSTSSLTKVGSGTLVLSATNSTFTGNVNVNGGVLQANASRNSVRPAGGALGNSQVAHTVTLNNSSTLQFMLGDTFGGSSTAVFTTVTANAGGIITNNGNNFTTLGPLVLNGGSLVANGGAQVLYQSFFLRSSVTVGGSSPSTITASGTNSGIHLYFSGAGTTFNVADVTNNANADLTVSAVLINGTDPGATGDLSAYPGILTKTGAGTMTVTQNSTYTGNTTVNAGILNMLNLSTPAATVTATGTGSQLNVTSLSANTLTIGPGATVTIAAIPGGPSAGFSSISPVPEPSIWAMLMLAAMGLGIYWRRSR